MPHRLNPEDCLLLEHNLKKIFGSLFPDSSGTVYFPKTLPRGIYSEKNGFNDLPQLQQAHGFGFGDTVLCALAGELHKGCPEQSLLARYTDTVFGILIPGTGPVQSKKIAVKLQEHLENQHFCSPLTKETVSLRLSLGGVVLSKPASHRVRINLGYLHR